MIGYLVWGGVVALLWVWHLRGGRKTGRLDVSDRKWARSHRI